MSDLEFTILNFINRIPFFGKLFLSLETRIKIQITRDIRLIRRFINYFDGNKTYWNKKQLELIEELYYNAIEEYTVAKTKEDYKNVFCKVSGIMDLSKKELEAEINK